MKKKLANIALAAVISGCSSVVIIDGLVDNDTTTKIDSCNPVFPMVETNGVNYIFNRCSIKIGITENVDK